MPSSPSGLQKSRTILPVDSSLPSSSPSTSSVSSSHTGWNCMPPVIPLHCISLTSAAVYPSSTAANPPSAGAFPSHSNSFSSSFSSPPSGSSPNRPAGSSKQTANKKHGISSAVCVEVLARMRSALRLSSRISRVLWRWRIPLDIITRIWGCCLTISQGSCILDGVCSWWLGCRLCRSGLGLLVLQFVCFSSPPPRLVEIS